MALEAYCVSHVKLVVVGELFHVAKERKKPKKRCKVKKENKIQEVTEQIEIENKRHYKKTLY